MFLLWSQGVILATTGQDHGYGRRRGNVGTRCYHFYQAKHLGSPVCQDFTFTRNWQGAIRIFHHAVFLAGIPALLNRVPAGHRERIAAGGGPCYGPGNPDSCERKHSCRADLIQFGKCLKNCGSVLRTLEDGSGHRRGASIGKQEGSAKGSARGVPLPEMHEAKVQHEHCRQTDAQVVEPGADSTLLIVIVTGEGGK